MNLTSKPFLCLLALALIGALPVAAPAADVPPVPVKDFARKAEFLSAKISPTGEYLAVSMPVEVQVLVAIIDIKTRKVIGAIRLQFGEHVYDYEWVGPQRVVGSIANTGGPLDQPRLTGELVAMNADGSGKTYLFGFRGAGSRRPGVEASSASAYLLDPMPYDPEHALISIRPWRSGPDLRSVPVERINVRTGARSRVSIVPGFAPMDVVTDRAGRLRFAYSTDEDDLLRLFVKADTPTGWKEVPDPNGPPTSVTLHRSTADGNSIFLTTSDKSGRACLREFRFDKGTLVERVCSPSGVVGRPLFGFDDDALIGLLHADGKPEVEYLDPKHADAVLLRSLARTFPGQRASVTSHTVDGTRVLAFVYSGRNPGDYYLVDRKTLKAEYLVSTRSWIDPKAMAPSEAVSYKTRDGATIHGYLTARAGLETRKAPLVLMPHGGPHGIRDYWGWDSWAQVLASRNYAVLQVNYRGSGGYGVAHQEAGYKKWGTLMQDDLTDAVNWAIDQGIGDPARVCIMGASYGGYAALMSPVREPDLYRCAIGFAGVYDVETQIEGKNFEYSRWGRQYLEEVFGDDDDLMVEQSPVTHLEKLKAAVLIAHGTKDEIVRFEQAQLLRKALKKHGKPYEWIEFKGEEHGFYVDANHEAFLNKVLDFLDRHIGPGAGPAAGSQTQ